MREAKGPSAVGTSSANCIEINAGVMADTVNQSTLYSFRRIVITFTMR